MLKPPDRRARRSRAAIEDALIALVIDRGYDAVTVREIIERADVSRSTFYAHYTDKHPLLRACLDRLRRFLHPPAETSADRSLFAPGLFAHVAEQRDLCQALLGRRGAATLVRANIEQLLGDALRERLGEVIPRGGTPVLMEIVVRSMVGAYLTLLTSWLDGDPGTAYSPAKMEEMFRTIAEPAFACALGLSPSNALPHPQAR